MSQPHILCISLTPALDRYVTVGNFTLGNTSRATFVDERAGGKNINAARAVRQVGGIPLAIAALGGHSGAAIIEAARREGIALVSTPTRCGTRQFTVIWDSDCEIMTQVSEPWSEVTSDEWSRYVDLIDAQLNSSIAFGAAAISGRMPPGVPVEEITSLIRTIKEAGIPCYVDAAGATLSPVLAAQPNGIKINNNEASEYLRTPVNSVQEAAEACKKIVSGGAESCIITMGIHGAVSATRSNIYHVAIDDQGPWPVGSGDSFLAALVVRLAQGKSWLDALIAGAAAGTANAHRQVAGLLDSEKFERGLKEAHCIRLS